MGIGGALFLSGDMTRCSRTGGATGTAKVAKPTGMAASATWSSATDWLGTALDDRSQNSWQFAPSALSPAPCWLWEELCSATAGWEACSSSSPRTQALATPEKTPNS